MSDYRSLSLNERLKFIQSRKEQEEAEKRKEINEKMFSELVYIANMTVGDLYRGDTTDARERLIKCVTERSIDNSTPVIDVFEIFIVRMNCMEASSGLADAIISPFLNSGKLLNAFDFSWYEFMTYLDDVLPKKYEISDYDDVLTPKSNLYYVSIPELFKSLYEYYTDNPNEKDKDSWGYILYIFSYGVYMFNAEYRNTR